MKTNNLLQLILGVCIILFFSCSDEDDLSTDKINCNAEHPKNTVYQDLINNYTQSGSVGLALLIADPEDGLWMGSSGYANLKNKIKMKPDYLHHTASIYKTFIATIIMQLVEENKIDINDKLKKYVDSDITNRIANGSDISIKNLLQHRTGVRDIFENDFFEGFFMNPTKQYTIKELLEYVYDEGPLFEEGTEYHYSDANYSLLTLVIDKVEGSHINSIRTRIFKKLDLQDSYFLEQYSQEPIGLVDSYWDIENNGSFENISEIQNAVTSGLRGSDGVVMSTYDLYLFMRALVKGSLVKDISSMKDFIATPTEIQEQEGVKGYGYGLMQLNLGGKDWYGHLGNHVGSGAIMLYNQETVVLCIAFQNTGTFFSEESKAKFFYHLIRDVESAVLNEIK
ncbi:serine hydrolase domain-containing protein [Aquimarina sediminis]|uniref:serine hydrolase domain-containing protein n=1 Tax=Aquimarina sediminis TaxID=2070536 RepID=UPI000CA08EDA|nr:serine hydrolase domain-containing protein [Aquimarina sediminis]